MNFYIKEITALLSILFVLFKNIGYVGKMVILVGVNR